MGHPTLTAKRHMSAASLSVLPLVSEVSSSGSSSSSGSTRSSSNSSSALHLHKPPTPPPVSCSYSERRTTPWKHKEVIVNGIRMHYVHAEPARKMRPSVSSPINSNSSTATSASTNPGGLTKMALSSSSSNTSTFVPDQQSLGRRRHRRSPPSPPLPPSPPPPPPPLIVLLHGFPEFWYTWRFQITAFVAAGYQVVAPDLRGYNLTEKPSSGYTLDALSEDIRQLILHLLGSSDTTTTTTTTTSTVYLMGHDWGGVIACAVAARFPDLVAKLIVLQAPHLAAVEHAQLEKRNASRTSILPPSAPSPPPTTRISSIGSILSCCPTVLPELLLGYNHSWLLSCMFFQSSRHSSTPSDCNSTPEPPPSATPPTITDETVTTATMPSPVLDEEALYRDAMSQPGSISCMLAYFRNLRISSLQSHRYGKIQCPVLVLWPDHDNHGSNGTAAVQAHVKCLQTTCTLPVEYRIIHIDRSNGNCITCTDYMCGVKHHWIQLEKAEQVNRWVLQFLSKEE